MPIIELKDISKSYGDIKAADHLDFRVNDGEYLCLLGPTGAGKTTTLRIIAGLTKPDQGSVSFDGRDITSLEPEDRKAVLLSQTYSLFPTMTVAENVLFSPNIKRMARDREEALLTSLLDLVRLSGRSDAYPRELSGGMQQRNALARALASEPDVLLLDEPLRALDARLRIDLRKELRSLAKTLKLTVIHVTHDQDEALIMADRIAVIRKGRIVQIGTPPDIFNEPVSPFVANFVGQSNFIAGKVSSSGAMTVVHEERGNTVLARESKFSQGTKVVVGVKVGNTKVVKGDDAFLRGRIERILFEGKSWHIDVLVEGLGSFSSKMPSKLEQFQVGDMVGIGWSPDKASVWPYPEHGLEEELKVD